MRCVSVASCEQVYQFGEPTVIKELYERFRAIQVGEAPDRFGWCTTVDTSFREHMPSDAWVST